jgi:DNA replication protein DnaC
MLTHPTLDQLRALKLDGMADAFLELEQQDAARDLTHAEWLALLLDREIANRTTKRTQIRLRAARLRYSQASVEDVNYRAQRQLDKALFQQLAACRWIAEKRNLLVGGKCGLGKTWLACALAQRACREGYRAYYARMPRLFAQLELAHADGSFHRLFRSLTKVDLLILDLGEV